MPLLLIFRPLPWSPPGTAARQAGSSFSRACQRSISGKLPNRQLDLLRVGQRHAHGEVGNRQPVADRYLRPRRWSFRTCGELLEEAGRFLDCLGIGRRVEEVRA